AAGRVEVLQLAALDQRLGGLAVDTRVDRAGAVLDALAILLLLLVADVARILGDGVLALGDVARPRLAGDRHNEQRRKGRRNEPAPAAHCQPLLSKRVVAAVDSTSICASQPSPENHR